MTKMKPQYDKIRYWYRCMLPAKRRKPPQRLRRNLYKESAILFRIVKSAGHAVTDWRYLHGATWGQCNVCRKWFELRLGEKAPRDITKCRGAIDNEANLCYDVYGCENEEIA